MKAIIIEIDGKPIKTLTVRETTAEDLANLNKICDKNLKELLGKYEKEIKKRDEKLKSLEKKLNQTRKEMGLDE